MGEELKNGKNIIMSKFSEYLKLIPKGLPNADKVLEGVVNQVKLKFGNLSEEEQGEIIRRRLICQSCPFSSFLAKESKEAKELLNEPFETNRTENFCVFCGCPIITKTASLSAECGISDWNEKYPDRKLELKWNKFK